MSKKKKKKKKRLHHTWTDRVGSVTTCLSEVDQCFITNYQPEQIKFKKKKKKKEDL